MKISKIAYLTFSLALNSQIFSMESNDGDDEECVFSQEQEDEAVSTGNKILDCLTDELLAMIGRSQQFLGIQFDEVNKEKIIELIYQNFTAKEISQIYILINTERLYVEIEKNEVAKKFVRFHLEFK